MARFLGWPPDRVTVGKRALLVQGSWATTWHSIQVINSASARSAVAKSDDTAVSISFRATAEGVVHDPAGQQPDAQGTLVVSQAGVQFRGANDLSKHDF